VFVVFNPSALPAVNPEFKDALEGESLFDKKSNEIGKVIGKGNANTSWIYLPNHTLQSTNIFVFDQSANIGNIGIAAVKYLDKGNHNKNT